MTVAARPGTGKAAVLVVEDEALILMAVGEALEVEGYEPILAQDAQHALSILEERPDIAVMFSDIRMPGMDGISLAQQVSREHPGLRVILASGHHPGDPSNRHFAAGFPFLAKPYPLTALMTYLAVAVSAAT